MIYNCKDIYDNPSEYDELLDTRGYLVYGFHNTINDKWYIGDTKESIRSRLFREDFVGWGHFVRYKTSDDHLYRSMRKYGLDKFTFEVLYKGEYSESIEEEYIKKYDSFNNGYNNSPDGKSFDKGGAISGRIPINNGISDKWIKPDELDYYESIGYSEGFSNSRLDTLRSNISNTHDSDHAKSRIESDKANHGGVMGWNTPESRIKAVSTMRANNYYGSSEFSEQRRKSQSTRKLLEGDDYLSYLRTDEAKKKRLDTLRSNGYSSAQLHTEEVRNKIHNTKLANGTYDRIVSLLSSQEVRSKAANSRINNRHILLDTITNTTRVTSNWRSLLKKYSHYKDLGLYSDYEKNDQSTRNSDN